MFSLVAEAYQEFEKANDGKRDPRLPIDVTPTISRTNFAVV